MAIIGFSHLTLKVERVEVALAFFRDVLGMRCVREPATRDGVGDFAAVSALLVGEGLRLELAPRDPRGEPHVGGTPADAQLTFLVDDLTATLHSLRDRGIEAAADLRVDLAPGVANARVRGPDGIAVGLWQRPTGVATAFDAVEGGPPPGARPRLRREDLGDD